MTPLAQKLRQFEKWAKEKIHLIQLWFQHKENPQKLIARMGDIYWAKLGINVGGELDKNRPVVIFQGNDWYLKNSDVVFVIPITSNLSKRKYSVEFCLNDLVHGNVQPGTVLLQQGRSISKFRLGHKIARFKTDKLLEIQEKLEKFLYKNTPLEPKLKGDNLETRGQDL